MQLFSLIFLVLATTLSSRASPVELAERASGPKGIDVSAYQPNVNWATVKANGIKFVYIKATEGTG